MKPKLRRTVALTAVVPLMLAGVAACGDDSDEKDDNETSQTSTPLGTDGTDTTDGTNPTDGTDGDEAPGGDLSTEEFANLMTAGIEATTTAKVVTRSETNGMVTVSEGVTDMSGRTLASHMTMTMQGQTTEMIMIDGDLYMKMPGSEGWTKMSASDATAGGVEETAFDPQALTQAFLGGLKSVETIGEEDVNGVATTHYRMVTDITAAMEALGSPEAAAGMDDITQDVWLDSEGRSVKSSYEMEMSGVTMKSETLMSDFGAPVTIEAPPADEVTEMR